MPVYDESELDAINEASETAFKKKLAVWKATSKKNRSKTEPRRNAPAVQEFACFAFMQNCLLRKDGKGWGICEDNDGPIGVMNDESCGNLVGKICSCRVCRSTCMVEYKEGEEQRIRLAARWAEEESAPGSDEDQQGRDFARSFMGFAKSSQLFLEQNNDEVNKSNLLTVMSKDMCNFEMTPHQRFLLRKGLGPRTLRVKEEHHIRTLDKPPRSGNRGKNNSLVGDILC